MRFLLLTVLFLLATIATDTAAPGPPDRYAAQWKKIDALLNKDQTATAAPLVESIYQQAKKANDAPAYVRALLYKVRLLERKEEDADEKAIALLEADVKTAGFPARPILHSLLGGLYTNYLNNNRYRLYQRTAGADPSQDDATPGAADGGTGLATWDMGRLGAAIVRHYYQSVEDEPQKQLNTTLADLGHLALGGNAAGRALRPTLYDLLAHRAIAGLQNQELYITKPEEQFEVTDPQLFGPAAEFAVLPLEAPEADSLNGQLHVLRLLQRLTAQRLTQPQNLSALADVDLQRLDYLHNLTQSTDLNDYYVQALARMAGIYMAQPIGTEFNVRRAEFYWKMSREKGGEKDFVNAAQVALLFIKAAEVNSPKSRGAAQARQLRAQIEALELSFSAADMVVPGQPWRLDVQTRNVTGQLYARAYRISLNEWEKRQQYDPKNRTVSQRFARALRSTPVAWTVPVPAHPQDYKAQQFGAAGAALPVGYYLVLMSNQADNQTKEEPGTVTSYAFVGASELSALKRQDVDASAPRLLVLDRQTGALLAGVKAQASYMHYDRKQRKQLEDEGGILQTDNTGEVLVPSPQQALKVGPNEGYRLHTVRIWRGTDTLLLTDAGYHPGASRDQPEQASRQTFLFTDRAIYRPGQTLYFKGILTETLKAESRLLTGQPASVRLVDVNGQTVQTLTFTTSDFGSFHGSFVLPTGLLNGEMSLQADHGTIGFSVEDYKRPTFLVKLDSVPGRPVLGQPLTMNGRAQAYSGQPTDGATVSYRVTRRELWPLFSYGGGGYGGGYGRGIYPPGGGRETQEIAHGTATTDAEGRFSITFTPPAAPARTGRWEPGFLFEVTADVTDAAGETRTGTRSLVIGRNPLSLRLAGPDKVDKQQLPDINLFSTNATGEPLPAAGTLRLLALSYRPNPAGVPGPPPETKANEVLRVVKTQPFDTKNGARLDAAALLADVPTGRYRLEAFTPETDTTRLDFVLYDNQARTIPYATPDWFVALADSVRPGQPASILLGSSENGARVLLEVERGGQLLQKEWLTLTANEQRRLTIASGPADAPGPLYIHTTQVRDNALYRHDATVQVAEPPQPLQLALATFRDKLQPGEKETWRLTIRQANGKPADAELLATLYDQSLDVFRRHGLQGLYFGQSYFPPRYDWRGEFGTLGSEELANGRTSVEVPEVDYPRLNTWDEVIVTGRRVQRGKRALGYSMNEISVAGGSGEAPIAMASAPAMNASADRMAMEEVADAQAGFAAPDRVAGGATPPASPAPDLSLIPARADFRETALWEPALRTDKNGDVVLEFQMPEAVTRWQVLALAHDQNLHSGQLARQLVTQKQVQISPNAPRFFRQGDTFTFPAKFSNLTDAPTRGTAQLFLTDAATGQDLTAQLLKSPAQQPVSAGAHQSAATGWQISLPSDFAPVAVTYRVVVSAELGVKSEELSKKERRKRKKQLLTPNSQLTTDYTDGEQNTLPVLPNRILITESLPLPIVGPATREFELTKLTSTSSPTRRNYSLTLEMTANPAWYAVQSLPYLQEYPYECSEQVFSRLYANLLAAQILKSNPDFKRMLAEWTRQAKDGTAAQKNALESKLAQNQDLKNLLLQETPWVRDAQSETERLARLSELFDETRLKNETARALRKLRELQRPDGGFPWFERMPDDRYITQLIVAGFGKLQKLGAFNTYEDAGARSLVLNALAYLDRALARDYAELRRQKGVKLADNHLGDIQIQALYARSFWPARSSKSNEKAAYDYYQEQTNKYWTGRTRYLQAQIALALFRDSKKSAAAADILRALAENALHSPELGMYWKDVTGGYYWREAPTETQATLIEAFHEVRDDQKSVDEMKLWLLKQKQTHHWPSTRATADACYALLLRGSNWLTPSQPLQVTVGGQPIRPEATQAGTGYYKVTWPAAEIKPAQGKVTVKKPDAGVAWGALYWQYFEDMDKVTTSAAALSVERELYRETRTSGGPKLEKLTAAAPLQVGDVLVVRLVMRTDRELEYVHLKDQRAAGLEPTQQTSGYRYQNGLGYYESPRDAATNFFLSTVPRGTHVFEYRLRASQAGNFSGGLSQLQCLYAPEFGATSAGTRVVVKPQ